MPDSRTALNNPVEPELRHGALVEYSSHQMKGNKLSELELRHSVPVPAPTTNADQINFVDEAARAALARLFVLPGMDAARCLLALRGQAGAYLDLLRNFVETHAADMTRLSDAMASGELAAVARLIHTLKGSAATLGADQLAGLADSLQQSLRTNAGVPRLDRNFRAAAAAIRLELGAISDALPSRMAALETVADQHVDPASVRQLLQQLDAFLAQNDTAAIALLQANIAPLSKALGAAWGSIADQIKRFEFESARKMLQRSSFFAGSAAR